MMWSVASGRSRQGVAVEERVLRDRSTRPSLKVVLCSNVVLCLSGCSGAQDKQRLISPATSIISCVFFINQRAVKYHYSTHLYGVSVEVLLVSRSLQSNLFGLPK